MIWSGYCESKVGQQSKAAAGGAADIFVAIAIFAIMTVGAGSVLNKVFGIPFGFVIGFLATVFLLWKFGERLELRRDSALYCRRQQTVYVLTDERVLVFRNCNKGVPVRSVPLRFIDRVRVVGERWDGRGTVELLSWNPSTGMWTIPLRFFMVRNAKQVMDLVEAAVMDGA